MLKNASELASLLRRGEGTTVIIDSTIDVLIPTDCLTIGSMNGRVSYEIGNTLLVTDCSLIAFTFIEGWISFVLERD